MTPLNHTVGIFKVVTMLTKKIGFLLISFHWMEASRAICFISYRKQKSYGFGM